MRCGRILPISNRSDRIQLPKMFFDWFQQQRATLESLPPKQAMRRAVYWGAIIIAALLIAFTSVYLQRIPGALNTQIDEIFSTRPWARPLAIVDGRDIILRGTVEPGSGLEREIKKIQRLTGVRGVSNQLEEQPLPSAEVHLSQSDNKIDMRGKLSGDDLDVFIKAVQRAYPDKGLRDRIKIDDRLGRPLWLDGLEQALVTLSNLQQYSLHAWRDAMLVDGISDSEQLGLQVKYEIPAILAPEIRVSFQLRTPRKNNLASLSLIAGWNGSAMTATVSNALTGQALESGFDQLAADADPKLVSKNLTIDRKISESDQFASLARLIGALGQVHDLRLETSGNGVVVWGRVDSAIELGQISAAIKENNLTTLVDNQIYIDAADRMPEISLFRDNTQAIVSGRLPNHRSRENLISVLERTLGVEQVEDFINIEPNIAFSPWLEQWPRLSQMPRSVFGLTVADNTVFVTGQVASWAEQQAVVGTLTTMFPEMQLINWLTIADVSFQGSRGLTPTTQD